MVDLKKIRYMWVAREQDGSLWLYMLKPIRHGDGWTNDFDDCPQLIKNDEDWDFNEVIELKPDWFPEVTYENSPVEVDLIIKKNDKGI